MAIDQNIRQLIYDSMVSAPSGYWTQVDAIIEALKEVGLDLDDYYLETPPPVQRRLVRRPPLRTPSDVIGSEVDKLRGGSFGADNMDLTYDDMSYMDEDGGYDAYVGYGGTE